MKYITTKTNPIFKEGIELENSPNFKDHIQISLNSSNNYLPDYLRDQWIRNEWIKEVEEPEFTKSDMIDYGCFRHGMTLDPNEESERELLNDFIEQRNKKS